MKHVHIVIILLMLCSCARSLKVTDAEGNAIPGASVFQTRYSLAAEDTKMTNSRGRVWLHKLPRTESLGISKEGYKTFHSYGLHKVPRRIVLYEGHDENIQPATILNNSPVDDSDK